MAAISLFGDTNMAAVTSRANALYKELRVKVKLHVIKREIQYKVCKVLIVNRY